MANDIKDFLDQTKVDVAAVSGINLCYIAPFFDIESLMSIPRFPAAIINDGGGELDENNGQLWRRTLEITLVNNAQRDARSEYAVRQLLDIGDALVTALEHNTTDSVYLAADSDIAAITTGAGITLVSKTYAFEYMIDRST